MDNLKCVVCECYCDKEELVNFKEVQICEDCIEEIKDL